jgi:hypothetical protein
VLFDSRAALLAGVLTALYPGAISASILVLSEAPFCPLMILQLLCWSAASRLPPGGWTYLLACVGGLAAGGATLVRPSWLLFTPFAAVVALVAFGDRRRQRSVCVVMILVLAATMMPWWIRNYRITGRFVATTLQVGASLYDGLSPTATGASEMSFVSRFHEQQRREDAAASGRLASTFEYRLDQRLRAAAIEWVRQQPHQALRLMGVKFARLWSPWPNAPHMQRWAIRLVVFLGYAPLLVLGASGLVMFGPRGWPYVLCVMPAIYFTCLHTVFVSSIRYRQPAMLAVAVLASGVLAQVVAWRRPNGANGGG